MWKWERCPSLPQQINKCENKNTQKWNSFSAFSKYQSVNVECLLRMGMVEWDDIQKYLLSILCVLCTSSCGLALAKNVDIFSIRSSNKKPPLMDFVINASYCMLRHYTLLTTDGALSWVVIMGNDIHLCSGNIQTHTRRRRGRKGANCGRIKLKCSTVKQMRRVSVLLYPLLLFETFSSHLLYY